VKQATGHHHTIAGFVAAKAEVDAFLRKLAIK